jgi:ornithine carbamoyltransferase
MKFTINGDPTEYQMLDTNLTFAEARAVETVTGKAFQSLATDEAEQTVDVIQALVWVSMKRVNPTLLFSDLDDIDMSTMQEVAEESDEVEAAPVPLDSGASLEVEMTSPSFV